MPRRPTLGVVPVEPEPRCDRPTLHEAEANEVGAHHLEKRADHLINFRKGSQTCELFRHDVPLVKVRIEGDARRDEQHDLRESLQSG